MAGEQEAYERLEVNAGAETAAQLREVMEADSKSVTEVVRRAVGVYYRLWKVSRAGMRIFFGRDSNDITEEFKLLP